MCQTHGTLVDKDEKRFPIDLLREWKTKAEDDALQAIGKAERAAEKKVPNEPDVSVVFSWDRYAFDGRRPVPGDGFKPPPFEIANYGTGHATEVEVHDLAGGDLIAEFPLIADLASGASITRRPTVKNPTENPGIFWSQYDRKGIDDLLEAADQRRERERLQGVAQASERLTELQMNAIMGELATRIEIGFRVTYWNREHTRQWEKSERLCFEPNEHRAYILHGERRMTLRTS